jgi:hypothetical protein
MRKVGESKTQGEQLLEDKFLSSYSDHLERWMRDFNSTFQSHGMDRALQSQDAQRVAQYSHVVQELSGILEKGEGLEVALDRWIAVAVAELRDMDTPRWKSLATATVLEALQECVGLEG